jgi:hypothetical protein
MVTLVDKLRLRPRLVVVEEPPEDEELVASLQDTAEPLVVTPIVTNLIKANVVDNDLSLVSATGYTILRPLADYLAMLGSAVSSTAVTQVQMRNALVTTGGGAIYTVSNAIPADIADPVNVAWTSSNVVSPGDALAVSIQASLGYSTAQMDALFALARTM